MATQYGARLGVGTLMVLFTCNLACHVNSYHFKRSAFFFQKRKQCSLCPFFFTLIKGKLALFFLVFATKPPLVCRLFLSFFPSVFLSLFFSSMPPSLPLLLPSFPLSPPLPFPLHFLPSFLPSFSSSHLWRYRFFCVSKSKVLS